MPFDVTGSAGVGDDITIPSALARTWELAAGRHDVTTVLPGACIMITVLALNFIGDGLNDALNPRRGR